MLIPHLHFCGDCEEAIAIYEKAFHTKTENIVYSHDYARIVDNHDDKSNECPDNNRIAHAAMNIHGQKVCLNDRFGNADKSLNCAVHLIVMFPSVEETLYIGCETSFYSENYADEVKEKLDHAGLQGYQAVRDAHKEDYQELYKRVEFRLAGEDAESRYAEDYFQYGRYLMIASSRPGSLPANLQGIWNESMMPPWDSK